MHDKGHLLRLRMGRPGYPAQRLGFRNWAEYTTKITGASKEITRWGERSYTGIAADFSIWGWAFTGSREFARVFPGCGPARHVRREQRRPGKSCKKCSIARWELFPGGGSSAQCCSARTQAIFQSR